MKEKKAKAFFAFLQRPSEAWSFSLIKYITIIYIYIYIYKSVVIF